MKSIHHLSVTHLDRTDLNYLAFRNVSIGRLQVKSDVILQHFLKIATLNELEGLEQTKRQAKGPALSRLKQHVVNRRFDVAVNTSDRR